MSKKFRVLAGSHVQNGRLYRAVPGYDIVPSEHDLTKNFREKFIEVPESTPESEGIRLNEREATNVKGAEEALKGLPKDKDEAIAFAQAAVANSKEKDDEIAGLKRRLAELESKQTTTAPAPIAQTGASPVATPTAVEEAGEDGNDAPATTDAPASTFGVDVTDTFPKVKEQDFKVFKRSRKYFIYDNDVLTKDGDKAQPLNKDGCTKDSVEGVALANS